MFIPSAFAETDLIWLDQLLARDAFITLISTGSDGLPCVSLLPVLYRRDADGVLIEGHWARANPQASHSGQVLLLVHGLHSYISPGWYPDKEAAARVPTWNYAAAQLTGQLEQVNDPDELAGMLGRLSAHHEAEVGGDWVFDSSEMRQRRMLNGIVGFRFRPSDIQIKLKLSQNHPEANQQAVIQALASSAAHGARDVGQWMQQHHTRRSTADGPLFP